MRGLLLGLLLASAGCSNPPSGATVVGSTPFGSLDLETEDTCGWRDPGGLWVNVRSRPMVDGVESRFTVLARAEPMVEAGFAGDVLVFMELTPSAGGFSSQMGTGRLEIGRARDRDDNGVRFEGVLFVDMGGFSLELDVDAGPCDSDPSGG